MRRRIAVLFVVAMFSETSAQTDEKKIEQSSIITDRETNCAAMSGGTDMDKRSLEENKALIRMLFEQAINHQDLQVMEGMVSANYISHNDSLGPAVDMEQGKKFLVAAFAAFPDIHVTIDDIIAEGDKVVVRNTWRGTFTGPWTGIAPTDKKVTFTGIVIWRIINGKIKERWANTNFPEVMQKIAAAQGRQKR
jgi:predicted ester cyclase